MAKLTVPLATTSKTVSIFVGDSSKVDGSGLTGLTYASSGLTWYYRKDGGGSATAVTLVTASVGAWSSGGFVEVDATNMPGWYELGVPNAALSTGTWSTHHLKGATNMVPVPLEIQLDPSPIPVNVTQVDGVALTSHASGKLPADLLTVDGAALTSHASGKVPADVLTVAGTSQTARDLGASVLLSTGTGTGQLDFTAGVVKTDVTKVDGSALTSHASGKMPADVLTIAGTTQTARDIGASVLLSSGTGTGQIVLTSGLVSPLTTGSGLKKNQAFTSLPFVMRSDTTKLPVAGLTVTVKRMVDAGGSFIVGGLTNVIDVGNGGYTMDGIAGDVNGKYVTFLATATGADPTIFTLITVP